jgi:hypothetical protein
MAGGILSRTYGALRAWWGDSVTHLRATPAAAAGVGIALLVGGLSGMPVNERVFDYMWKDSRFCDDCHVHDYANEAYERSIHASLTTCHDCHLVPIRHYPRNLMVTLFDTPQSPDDIHRPDVSSVICERCHSNETDSDALTGPMSDELRAQVVKIDDSPLHRLHLSSKERQPASWQGGNDDAPIRETEAHATHGVTPSWDEGVITCMDCHGAENNRAHSFTATRTNCVACHTRAEPTDGDHAAQADDSTRTLECRECHFQGFIGNSGS